MPDYFVTGTAFIPVQVKMRVTAASAEKAIEKAKKAKYTHNNIIPGTEDESCVFDWDPSVAEETAPQPTQGTR